MTNEDRETKQAFLKDYIEEGQHKTGLKTFKQIAREIGVCEPTARRWITQSFPEVAQEIRSASLVRYHLKLERLDEDQFIPPPLG